MYRLVALGEVEDLEKWEKGFRTRGERLKKQTIKNPINFGVSENNNEIAIIFEFEDFDKYFEILICSFRPDPRTANRIQLLGYIVKKFKGDRK
ncbi:MAG: hypothetical protein GY928_36020 [Colwellia sp.]|nr:hypothetical protein [Colwellia sp.]